MNMGDVFRLGSYVLGAGHRFIYTDVVYADIAGANIGKLSLAYGLDRAYGLGVLVCKLVIFSLHSCH
jgi:hypothetical protein